MPSILLNTGREKTILRRHPWIFSGALKSVVGDPEPGATVEVRSADNTLLGHAAWSPESQICGRVWSFDPAEKIDADFFRRKIRRAIELRNELELNAADGGCRLIASEADGLPGVIADRYGDFAVVQLLSAGAEFHKATIAAILLEESGCRGVYERSDVAIRTREGLTESTGLLAGEEPPEAITIVENGIRFEIDIRHGHKTGFYLDQRFNRAAVARYAAGKEMLNCFAYTGGFAVAALAAGAKHAVNVDSSAPSLAGAVRNFELNGIAAERYENITADVFAELRKFRDRARTFDLIVLDPPKFVDSKNALMRGCRAYQDIARLAFLLLRPGGMLFTFSCSGLLSAELFQKVTADAALDAGVEAVIVGRLEQAPDHPTSLSVPESFYLKGLAVKKVF